MTAQEGEVSRVWLEEMEPRPYGALSHDKTSVSLPRETTLEESVVRL